MIHPWGIIWKGNFFQMRPKVFLTCLRWETVSNIYYFWSCFMHTLSSFIFLRPWWTSTPFHSKIARYSVHLSDSSMGDILKTSNFFTDETKNMVLTYLRSEAVSNIYNFWSFYMQSISSSNSFCAPGAILLLCTLREPDILFISVIQSCGNFQKEALCSQRTPKNWF